MERISLNEIKSWRNQLFEEFPFLEKRIYNATKEYTENTKGLFDELLKFLALVGTYDAKLTPTLAIDYAWHEFILFTKLYDSFCREKFNRFIHHNPDENKQSNANNFKKTIQLYILTFGEPNAEIWGNYAISEWNSAQCGSCEAN
ncbi:glycine-rich domain-containing protein [Aureivirga marina]|uniref:glycine-rich domain-containing protein n=1 Tax=Aureivirga marina TaxID=1182451 RepID=UPI0018C9D801|nr:hypothetical protein [Aureivirga marina]